MYPVVGRELRQLIPYGATKSFPTHHMALVIDMIETPVTWWLKIGIAIFSAWSHDESHLLPDVLRHTQLVGRFY